MIGRLRGIILEKYPPLVLLEVGGVSYEVHIPMTCFYKLPEIGDEAVIFTHFIARKDTHLLFGFNKKQERTLFQNLIKTNGIGPRLALIILSGISAQEFISAIKRQDLTALIKCPGIGKKIAERLIVEMKNSFKGFYDDSSIKEDTKNLVFTQMDTSESDCAEREAISALVALGYKYQEANCMVSKVARPNVSSEILIREALRAGVLRGK